MNIKTFTKEIPGMNILEVTAGTKGIFRIIGGKRKPTPRMVHDQSEQSVTIKRRPWLKPVVDKVRKAMPLIYFKALQFQKRRQRLFRSR